MSYGSIEDFDGVAPNIPKLSEEQRAVNKKNALLIAFVLTVLAAGVTYLALSYHGNFDKTNDLLKKNWGICTGGIVVGFITFLILTRIFMGRNYREAQEVSSVHDHERLQEESDDEDQCYMTDQGVIVEINGMNNPLSFSHFHGNNTRAAIRPKSFSPVVNWDIDNERASADQSFSDSDTDTDTELRTPPLSPQQASHPVVTDEMWGHTRPLPAAEAPLQLEIPAIPDDTWGIKVLAINTSEFEPEEERLLCDMSPKKGAQALYNMPQENLEDRLFTRDANDGIWC